MTQMLGHAHGRPATRESVTAAPVAVTGGVSTRSDATGGSDGADIADERGGCRTAGHRTGDQPDPAAGGGP
jgi:hypothetical protein